MIEKIFTGALKAMSALIYIAVVIVVLSIPVLFTVEAFRPPVFTLTDAGIYEIEEDDAYLESINETPENWYRAEYKMTAESGKFSPYYYEIDKFILSENKYADKALRHEVILDAPLYFTNTEKDDFTLSLYVKSNEDEETVKQIFSSAHFEAESYKKGFAGFYAYFYN